MNASNCTTALLPTKLAGYFDRIIDELPLYGYPGPMFKVIHLSALTSLSISTVVSISLMIFICVCRDSKEQPIGNKATKKDQNGETISDKLPTSVASPERISFWKWKTGERLVFYLAVTDLAFCFSHMLDHAYIFATAANPPDHVCAIFGFFLQEFMFAQTFIVLFTGTSACSLVVFGKKLYFGKRDWRLLLTSFGVPGINGCIAFSLGLLGQSGTWRVFYILKCYLVL